MGTWPRPPVCPGSGLWGRGWCPSVFLNPHPFPLPNVCPPPVLFKEVNTCNPSTITATLSRLSLDEDEDSKPCLMGTESGLNFSPLPGNILVPMPVPSPGVGEPPHPHDTNPVYMCGESSLRQLDYTWLRSGDPGSEGEYTVLPRRTLSLQPGGREEAKRARPEGTPRRGGKGLSQTEGYPSFLSVDHVGLGLGPAYGTLQNPYGVPFQPPPPAPSGARQGPTPEPGERSRTMPRTVPGSTMKLGSLEVRRLLGREEQEHTQSCVSFWALPASVIGENCKLRNWLLFAF